MERGTIYMIGRCGSLEMLFVDTDEEYFEYVKLNGEMVPEVPSNAQAQYRSCLHYRTRVSKEFSKEWLDN